MPQIARKGAKMELIKVNRILFLNAVGDRQVFVQCGDTYFMVSTEETNRALMEHIAPVNVHYTGTVNTITIHRVELNPSEGWR